MSFILFNETDGVPADPREFSTWDEAEAARKEFPKRYAAQGYYKTADGFRISPADVELVIEEV